MEACLEALLEMDFCTKPPNFGVEAHMEAPAGDALTRCGIKILAFCDLFFFMGVSSFLSTDFICWYLYLSQFNPIA
jgi:hypothetical protein